VTSLVAAAKKFAKLSWFNVNWKKRRQSLANQGNCCWFSLLMFEFTVLARCIELFVSSSEDFQMAAGKAIGRGNITDSRMQAHGVVIGNKVLNQAMGIFD
jgi:hypothetical protein